MLLRGTFCFCTWCPNQAPILGPIHLLLPLPSLTLSPSCFYSPSNTFIPNTWHTLYTCLLSLLPLKGQLRRGIMCKEKKGGSPLLCASFISQGWGWHPGPGTSGQGALPLTPPPALLQILQIAWRKVVAYQAAKGMAAASPPLCGPIQAGCFQSGASVSHSSNLPALAGRLLGFHLP